MTSRLQLKNLIYSPIKIVTGYPLGPVFASFLVGVLGFSSLTYSASVGFAKIRKEKTGGCYQTIQYPSVVDMSDKYTNIRIESLVDICPDSSSKEKEIIDFIAGYNVATRSKKFQTVKVRFAVGDSRDECKTALEDSFTSLNTKFGLEPGDKGKIKEFTVTNEGREIEVKGGFDFCYTIVEKK